MRRIPVIVFLLFSMAGCGVSPDTREPTARPPQTSSGQVDLGDPENRTCLANLGRRGASFSPLPDRMYGAGCETRGTVQLSRVGGDAGPLGVSGLGPLACPLANSFADWARFGVDRAARQILGSPLARIETMGSYACRDVAGTGRRSAHARAEAIDVAAFILADGRRISVQNDWNSGEREREFLRIVHSSACKRFGTVLGPDYNSAHRDHLHLEHGGQNFCR